jgi:hypothetical protein
MPDVPHDPLPAMRAGLDQAILMAPEVAKEGCTNPYCSRIDGVCVGWHCPRCGAPTSSQGHGRCPGGPWREPCHPDNPGEPPE